MPRLLEQVSLRLAASLVLSNLAPPASAGGLPDYVQAEHRSTLRAYLKGKPHLSIPPDELCECSQDLAALREERPGFQPYYSVGDINDDGVPDFAVALSDSRRPAVHPMEVRVVIFHGPFRAGRNSVGTTVIPAYKIERSGEVLSVFKARFEGETRYGPRLDLGPAVFGSDDHWIIQFNKSTRRYGVHYFY